MVGFVGSRSSLAFYNKLHLEMWTKAFAERGLELRIFITNRRRTTHQEVVDFYKQIDIQIYARRTRYTFRRFKDQLKLMNAGSFGIPSVCGQESTPYCDMALDCESRTFVY